MQPGDEQNDNKWTFRQENGPAETDAATAGEGLTPQDEPIRQSQPVTWTASEFIAHHKDAGWYASVATVFLILCAAVYLLTKDVVSVVTIAIVVFLFLIISANKPRQRTYSVDEHGISIDQKFYSYSDFKSFSASYEGVIGSVSFTPLKRFMPEIEIYFAPDDEQKIISVLSDHLPNEQRREQGIDRLMRRLRF